MWLQHGMALLAYHTYTLLCRGLRGPWVPLANPSLCSPFQCSLHAELSQSQGYASGRHRWTSLASLHLRISLYLEAVHQPGSLLWDQAWEKPVAVSFPLLWKTTLPSPWKPLLLEGGIMQTISLEICQIILPTYNRNPLKGCSNWMGKSQSTNRLCLSYFCLWRKRARVPVKHTVLKQCTLGKTLPFPLTALLWILSSLFECLHLPGAMQVQTLTNSSGAAALAVQSRHGAKKEAVVEIFCVCCWLLFAALGRFNTITVCDVMSLVHII